MSSMTIDASSNILDPASIKNLAGWTFSPLVEVGSRVGSLASTPSGLDAASKKLCKSQSYTSWDCLSRLYYGGAVVVAKGEQEVRARRERRSDWGDSPTREELGLLPTADQKLLRSGAKRYVRSAGRALTYNQYLKSLSKASSAPESATTSTTTNVQTRSATSAPTSSSSSSGDSQSSADPPPPPKNYEGYFYSDTLPVRCVAVSSMPSRHEEGISVPYSPVYQQLIGRLSDPAQTGVLGSTIRGPNVRDSTSFTALAKAMTHRPSSVHELAPMIRGHCMLLSVASDSHQYDPIRLRFVRNTHPNDQDNVIRITPIPGAPDTLFLITAAPFDTFVALANNSFFAQVPAGFEYEGLDNDWIAVPVRSALISQSHLLPYLACFAGSDLWAGTVCSQTASWGNWVDEDRIKIGECYVPVCNSVYIPGVHKIMMVLVDETADNVCATVSVSGAVIPVWRGRQPVVPVNCTNIWFDYWNSANVPNIRRDGLMAVTEICTRLGIGDSCGIASSISAELYGIWYYGLSFEPRANGYRPNFAELADGAWSYDGSAIDKAGKVKTMVFELTDNNKVSARRRCVAYNFSGHSPYHVMSSGVVKTSIVAGVDNITIRWSTPRPANHTPGYAVSTMSSLTRVGTYVGLILTHTSTVQFNNDKSHTQWLHMLSSALSFSASVFLVNNDLSPREWAGIDDRFDRNHRQSCLSNLKDSLFLGLLVHHSVRDLMNNWPDWDMDLLAEYYSVQPYNNINWMTYSGVPYHCTIQWQDKMGMTFGTANNKLSPFRWLGDEINAIVLTNQQGRFKNVEVGTIDLMRHFPLLVARESDSAYVPVRHWFDNVSYYSTALVQPRLLVDQSYFESHTACLQYNSLGIAHDDPTRWLVIDSAFLVNEDSYNMTYVSAIQYPDPPLLDTLWTGAKNYILRPAGSALLSLLNEGPVGAIVSGTGHVAQQIAKDLGATDKTMNKIMEVENAAREVLGLQKTSGLRDTQPTITPETTSDMSQPPTDTTSEMASQANS